MPSDTLIPGYTQVESFTNDEDYVQNEDGSVEEEVVYVTLDLGQVEPTLVPSTSSYRLIGLDTPTPYLQLQGSVFKGEHRTLLGTELLFSDSKEDQQDRIPSQKALTNVGISETRVRFKEVEIRPKKSPEEATAEQSVSSATSKKKQKEVKVKGLVGQNDAEEAGASTSRGRGRGRGRARGASSSGTGTGRGRGLGRGRGRGGAKQSEREVNGGTAEVAEEPQSEAAPAVAALVTEDVSMHVEEETRQEPSASLTLPTTWSSDTMDIDAQTG